MKATVSITALLMEACLVGTNRTIDADPKTSVLQSVQRVTGTEMGHGGPRESVAPPREGQPRRDR